MDSQSNLLIQDYSQIRETHCQGSHTEVKVESGQTRSPVRGRLFSFLEIPKDFGMGFHMNAFFELSSNRRDVWLGSDLQDQEQREHEWNQLIFRELAPPCLLALFHLRDPIL